MIFLVSSPKHGWVRAARPDEWTNLREHAFCTTDKSYAVEVAQQAAKLSGDTCYVEAENNKRDEFTFEGITITEPFFDESGRFPVNPVSHYGDTYAAWRRQRTERAGVAPIQFERIGGFA